MISEKEILQAYNNRWKVCTYGLGYLGKRLYKEIPEVFGLDVDYYSDGDDKRVDDIRIEGIRGIYKSELLKYDAPMLVFVLVDDPYDIDIKEELKSNTFLHTLTLRELINMEVVLRSFYGNDIYNEYCRLDNYKDGNSVK